MKKWLHHKQKKQTFNVSEFQNIRQESERIEQLQFYLDQLNNPQVPTKQPVSKRMVLLLAGCLCFVIGLTLFFLMGGPKKLNSVMTSNSVAKENYLQLEANSESPLHKFAEQGVASYIKFRAKNTNWQGKLDYSLYENDDSNIAHYLHTISGNVNKNMLSVTLDTTINDTKIGKTTYYTMPDSGRLCYYIPEYKTKPIEVDMSNRELYNTISSIPDIYDILSEYYKEFMDTITSEGSLSYSKNEPYSVGSLSGYCECYEFTLPMEQFKKLLQDISYKLLSDERFANINNNTVPYISLLSRLFSYNEYSDSSDDSPYLKVRVFSQNNQILGRSFSVLDSNNPYTIFSGYLKVDNELSYSCYIKSDSDESDDTGDYLVETEEESSDIQSSISKEFQFDLNSTEFNGTYNGSASLSTSYDEISVSFSNVTIDFNSSLIPFKGSTKVTVGKTSQESSYPNTYMINSLGNKDIHQLSVSFMNEDIIDYESENDYSEAFPSITAPGTLDLRITASDKATFSPPVTSSDKILSDGKAISKAFSSLPIEKYLNQYCIALQSKTRLSHEQALNMLNNGYMFTPIADLNKLNWYYSGQGSYYDTEIEDDVDTFYNPDYQKRISFLGDYVQYLVEDDLQDKVNAAKFEDIPETVKKHLSSKYKNGKRTSVTNTFESSIFKNYKSIQKELENALHDNFYFDKASTEVYLETTGNIFTDKQVYVASARTSVSASSVDADSTTTSGANISIVYDAFTGKISDFSLEIPYSTVDPTNYNNLFANLAHIINPSITVKECKKLLKQNANANDEQYTEIPLGHMDISISCTTTFVEGNDTAYYINAYFSCTGKK